MTTEKSRTLLVAAVLFLLVIPLLAGGKAAALYPPNGAQPTGVPGGYMNPDDGMCVVGIKADGTMKVDWDVKNARDCVAYTTGLTTLTAADITATSTCPTGGVAPYTTACNVKANCSKSDGSLTWSDALSKCFDTSACTIAGANPSDGFAHVGTNDGYKHAVTFSLCSNVTGGVSRVDLDNTDAMCVSKGGTVKYTAGNCIAYGWVYRNRKADGPPPTLPVSGTGIGTTDGVQSTDGLGFCYTAIRMTGGTYTVPVLPAAATSCPSWHNSPGVCTGGTSVGAACTANSNCTGAGSTCNLNNAAEWPACASSTTGCQTPASYDAGLGWSWDATNSRCVYAFGVNGPLNANVITAAGVRTLAGGASGDLTLITNQGDCLAGGYSWDNWLTFPTTIGGGYRTSADLGDFAGMPAGAKIVKFDAITPVDDGGGEFFSGTGFNCLKCHADQSRAYQERDKPGFVKTRHQKAGDDLSKPFAGYFTAGSSSWGLQGVQCAMCHSTAKPARDDLIQIVPAGVVGPPAAGAPKSATGHNQTEYGAHLLDVCYTCHGSAANPPTTNPASVIPVSAGDFALTSNLPGPATSNLGNANCTALGVPSACCTGLGTGTCPPPPNTAGLAPIMNQFLNSPHAMYTGSSTKVDIGNKTKYGSTFEGYVCRSAAGNFNRTSATSAACTAAGLTPYTVPGFGYTCYYNAAQCAAAPGVWNTTFDPNAYPWAVGPETGSTTKTTIGGVCSGLGLGSIQTTVYRNGVAEKIPNLDSTTNTACTNNGDGSATSGAAGFWVKDGEISPLGTPADTAQGNCMTCHDVHWALADTDPEAEAFRRECTTCHENSGPSASGAPHINLATINHLKTAGTPLENWLTEPDEACEICHMPNSGGAGSSRMHLWRINTDPAYQTMGATQANTQADGTYTNAAWVDLEHSCGQCHGGGTVEDAQHKSKVGLCTAAGVPDTCCSGLGTGTCAQYRTNAQLALVANGMHASAGITYPTTFSTVTNGLTVNMSASVTCNGACAFTYDWDCGAGGTLTQPSTTAPTASCAYASAGTKSIMLTVMEGGGNAGSATRSVTVSAPVPTPVAGVVGGGCPSVAGIPPNPSFDKDTWTASFTDASSPAGAQVTVEWGDGSVDRKLAGQAFSHKYRAAGAYLIVQKVIDSALQLALAPPCTVSPLSFTIDGHVYKSDGITGLGAATVSVRSATTGATVRTVYTDALGVFTVGSLRVDTYWIVVTKRGYTFPAPTSAGNPVITVGPSSTGNSIKANP